MGAIGGRKQYMDVLDATQPDKFLLNQVGALLHALRLLCSEQ